MKYQEIKGNLFEVGTDYTLVHCVSSDFAMGAGVAKTFVEKFPKMKPYLIKNTIPTIGNAILYSNDIYSHDVFNLITKEKYYHKPTRQSFNNSIDALKRMCVYYDINKLAMPLIGSGLDKLNWNESSKYIQEVFADTDIEILVVKLQLNKIT